MILVTDINGRAVYLHRDNIASVTEAGASSQWHGICCIVRTFDGSVIEAREKAADISAQIEAEQRAAESSGAPHA